MSGGELGERRRRKTRHLKRSPGFAQNLLRALARPGPGADHLAAEQMPDCGDRADIVEMAFGIPGRDAGVHDGIRQGEIELHRVVQIQRAAAGQTWHCRPLGDKSRELRPVSGRQFGFRAIGPVFRDHLLFGRQSRLDIHHMFGLVEIALGKRILRRRDGAELAAAGHREGLHAAPVRRDELRRFRFVIRIQVGQGLPAPGKCNRVDRRRKGDRHR